MLKSKVVLVSGACGLLGNQIVHKIVEQNGCVLVTDTDTNKAEKLFQNLPSEQMYLAPMDITDANSVDQAVAVGLQKFGSVDACINSSYPRTATWGAAFEKLEIGDIQENLKLQLGGAIILSQRTMKHFISQGHGKFIHMSSIQGIAAPKFEHYEGT